MRVLGIDPGSRTTGWGVVDRESGKNVLVAAGVVRTDPEQAMSVRLHTIHAGLAAVIEQFRPDVVALEEIFAHHSAASALVLGQARGVALMAAYPLPVSTYNNSTIKKGVTGSGKADKQQVARVVGLVLGVQGKLPADQTDALAIALTHLAHRGLAATLLEKSSSRLPSRRKMSSRDAFTEIAMAARVRA